MKALLLRFGRLLGILLLVLLAFGCSGRVIRWLDATSGGIFDAAMLQIFFLALVPFGLAILCAHLVCSLLFTTLRTWLGRKGLLQDWERDPAEPGSLIARKESSRGEFSAGIGPRYRVVIFFAFFAFLCALYAFFVFCSVLLLLVPA